jgi:hypothetical protein
VTSPSNTRVSARRVWCVAPLRPIGVADSGGSYIVVSGVLQWRGVMSVGMVLGGDVPHRGWCRLMSLCLVFTLGEYMRA